MIPLHNRLTAAGDREVPEHIAMRQTISRLSWKSTALAACLIVAASSAVAQTQPAPGAPQYAPRPQPGAAGQPAGPPAGQPGVAGQPAGPQAGPPTGPAPQAPFQLTQGEAAELDELLRAWEVRSAKVKFLECSFRLWEHDAVFNQITERAGKIKYRSPDHGMYKVEFVRKPGPPEKPADWQRVDGQHWCCDGKSVFEFQFANKVLIEHQLPPELQGEAIQHSPLPFLFVAKAEHLKKRYFLRIVTTPQDRQKGQIWLQCYPKWQQDAANFIKVELILDGNTFLPHGLKLFLPNGKDHTTHVFTDYQVNQGQGLNLPDILNLRLGNDQDFTPQLPAEGGWQKKVEPALAPASAPPPQQQPPSRPVGLMRMFAPKPK